MKKYNFFVRYYGRSHTQWFACLSAPKKSSLSHVKSIYHHPDTLQTARQIQVRNIASPSLVKATPKSLSSKNHPSWRGHQTHPLCPFSSSSTATLEEGNADHRKPKDDLILALQSASSLESYHEVRTFHRQRFI
jgi:hypothetical protein